MEGGGARAKVGPKKREPEWAKKTGTSSPRDLQKNRENGRRGIPSK